LQGSDYYKITVFLSMPAMEPLTASSKAINDCTTVPGGGYWPNGEWFRLFRG
jgi:hypothetical protein